MPETCKDDTPLNYRMMESSTDFAVKKHQKTEHPTADQITANKKKWGLTA